MSFNSIFSSKSLPNSYAVPEAGEKPPTVDLDRVVYLAKAKAVAFEAAIVVIDTGGLFILCLL